MEDSLMRVARDLLVDVDPTTTEARRRRAVSTAYYAVFHAICRVCADSLVGTRDAAHREAIYRTVEHNSARKHLTSAKVRDISPWMEQIGGNFADLQIGRHKADYRPGTADTLSDEQTRTLLELADRVLFALDLLNDDQRLAMAVLLISRPRPT
ncbi:hypothetical protein [Enterovirga rhinocerotis]|uniref:hypothetical protein n=1 Tax=Enterovirga rhinocerotis TaxID=1339210 RepID=UPI00141500E3|nr:hypothetical protein [Enterovirga rhinocerotis]